MNTLYKLKFDAAKLGASGFAGCNTFSGAYRVTGDAIDMGPFAATRMMCEPDVYQLETSFFRALAEVRSYRVTGTRLELLDQLKTVVATFNTD